MRFLKKLSRRIGCGVLSAVLLMSNVSANMTSYAAIGPNAPVNADGTAPLGNKAEDIIYTEESYVHDAPIRLQVSKVKTEIGGHEGITPDSTSATQQNTITYLVSGRVEGNSTKLTAKYGSQVELAYYNGTYLGYGWLKGTLEYLLNRQAESLDEEVELLYNEKGVFEGRAYVTRTLETADDTNRYVAGATMALYDAIVIKEDPSIMGDADDYGEDERFIGVTVERDTSSNRVINAYVNKGYAGNEVKYVLEKEDGTKINVDNYGRVIDDNYDYKDEINDSGEGVWIAKTIERNDTPILFYSLDDLNITTNDTYASLGTKNDSMIDDVFGSERYLKDSRLYGFDKEGNVIDATQFAERDFSIYAFEAGNSRPVFEFEGGDFKEIRYSLSEKRIIVGEGTLMYHLDENGNRDSLVDPQTGIAYVIPDGNKENGIYVWPVNVFKDETGAKTYRKIITSRIATFHADTENEYVTGTYNGSSFTNTMVPVLDEYGHPVYYTRSDETYVKGQDMYDYDGDTYLGYVYKDSLDEDNENAYQVGEHGFLYNGDADDPFDQTTHYQTSTTRSITLTVDMDGNYIVNGSGKVPTPKRDGYVFAGWLMDPDQLTDGCSVKAYWRSTTSSGMADAEREQWYSSNAASGTTQTMTITFDANGGTFVAGSGDIHSTDNLLYRRQGDSYLIQNIWITGENTPNDPFDDTKVDTVKNTAAMSGTISGSGTTGNDAYSDGTKAGGQADMLKRVHAGAYIMEETEAAPGYAKGFPVAFTVKAEEGIQKAEMTDVTIKAEFIKTDAPDSNTTGLYVEGVYQKDAAGNRVILIEPKGSYSHTHVPGAVLALRGKDAATKAAFSDWVKVTSHPDVEKKTESGQSYIEFATDAPLFIEGLPAGIYVLSEVETPKGYLPMEDTTIVIDSMDGVQIFGMNDDHTKVEIEKYYVDENGKQDMPNAYAATLALYDSGDNLVGEWKTDDLSDYYNTVADNASKSLLDRLKELFTKAPEQSFVDMFTYQMNYGDRDITTFSWYVTRQAVKASYSTTEKETWIVSDGSRVIVENGVVPATASAEFKKAYEAKESGASAILYNETMTITKDTAESLSLADQIWNVSDGSKMHISVNPLNEFTTSGTRKYAVEFKFNYRDDYTGDFINTVSYDSMEGYHRFDYLPNGSYTVKETVVPEGFVKADDKVFVVNATADVQRFGIENKRKQLEISKIALKDSTYYAGTENSVALLTEDERYAANIAGAKLTLYYSETQVADYETAFADGAVPAGVIAFDSWTSGDDGVYTKAEYLKELIREDQIGDFKPHVVRDLRNGWYYLVETGAPSYYATFTPKEIEVTDYTTADTLKVMAVDRPIPLEVKVHKEDESGTLLEGAVFLVKNKTLGGVTVGTITTDASGEGVLTIMDTGRFMANGAIEPYTFTIEEITAPAGFQVDPSVHEFVPSGDFHGLTTVIENNADASIINGVLHVKNAPSEIVISKHDFHDLSDVPGTTLAVYEAEQVEGAWQSSGVSTGSDWTWTIAEGEEHHTVTGLVAGKVYVLTETLVPNGYTKSDDIFFKISSTGRAVEKIFTDPEEADAIEFATDKSGAVESVKFSTRMAVGTYVVLYDLDAGTSVNRGTLSGGVLHLSAADVTDGNRYRMVEYVRYSDGTEDVIGTTTFLAKLYEDWMKVELSNALENLTVTIKDMDGAEIAAFTPDSSGTYELANPVVMDPHSLSVVPFLLNKNGVDHSAVQGGDLIRYEALCSGVGTEIRVLPAAGLEYIYVGGAEKQADGSYLYVSDREEGFVTFYAQVLDDATGYINQKVVIGGRAYEYLNPIAVNRGTGVFADSSKIVISSAVDGTHPDNKNAVFTFKVTLTKTDGSPLDGSYDYRTRDKSGTLDAYGRETVFTVDLVGNDFLVIHDLPYNTEYRVVQIVPSSYDFTVTNTTPNGKTSETAISHVLFTNTRFAAEERTLFEKNTTYIYEEILNFVDDTAMTLKRLGFTFGDTCQITGLGMLNKPTQVWFTKTDWTDCEELPGATCELLHEDGTPVLDERGEPIRWVSSEEPYKIVGVLEAGETYRFHEEGAPDGYSYSEDIYFTVSEDGTVDKVIMQDKPTVVSFTKETVTGEQIPGAEMKLYEVTGSAKALLDTWTSGTSAYVMTGKLDVEKTYVYHEDTAPNGYAYMEDIAFSLNKEGEVVNARFVDKELHTMFYDGNGIPTGVVIKTGPAYFLGDEEVFLDGTDIKDGAGTLLFENVGTEITVNGNVIRMPDEAFEVSLSKTDFAGAELPGATCEIIRINADGTKTSVDRWISGTTPYVMSDKLQAGFTYQFREEVAAPGYAYSNTIEFTIDRSGTVVNAHFIDEDGTPLLYDGEGYATSIKAMDGGIFMDGSVEVTIDANGDAVDLSGTVHAEDVAFDIFIDDNLVPMKDAPTELRLIKVDPDGVRLADGRFQILNEDRSPALAVRDSQIESTEHDGYILEGEPLIFDTTVQVAGVPVKEQLTAGAKYILKEVKPPAGHIAANERTFVVPYLNQKEPITVTIMDAPTLVGFEKVDPSGNAVPGANVKIYQVNEDASTTLAANWIAGTSVKELEAVLSTETTYRYVEETAPNGYGYSFMIEFTVNSDGDVVNTHYVSDAGEPVLYDADGYPTDIKVLSDGGYEKDGVAITINSDGNAVDGEGTVHARGVQYELPVTGNVVSMKDVPTKVRIIKKDLEGNILTGGKYQILDASGDPVKAAEDTEIASTEHSGMILAGEDLIFAAKADGVNITGLLNAETSYLLRELKAPAGYLVGADVPFTVPKHNQSLALEVIMQNVPTVVAFAKTDFAGVELPGATVAVYKVNVNGTETLIDSWVSTDVPHVIKGVLETGATYRFKETASPDGYEYSAAIEFMVDDDGKVKDCHYVNDSNEPILYDSEGYPTAITVQDGGTYELEGKEIFIDSNGDAVDAEGTVYAKGVWFELSAGENVVTMKDSPTKILFVKTDKVDRELSGGRYQILNSDLTETLALTDSAEVDGKKLFTRGEAMIFAAKTEGVDITGQLVAGRSYVLRELEAPDGYHLSDDVAFTVPYLNQKEALKVQMENRATVVKVLKVDEEGNVLSGAKLILEKTENGEEIDRWTSDGSARTFTGELIVGETYTLYEDYAPDGYYVSDPMTFTVKEDEIINRVVMTDEPVVVKLVKVKAGTDERLSGGKFSVLRKSDNAVVIPEFVLDGEITITGKLVAGETYLFHEIEAPAGYKLARDVEFTIPLVKTQDVITVVMENTKPGGGGGGGSTPAKPHISIRKYDGVTMEALPGAEYTFYDADGKVVAVAETSGPAGAIALNFKDPGTYTFKETKAPEGYKADDTVYTFDVSVGSYEIFQIPNYEEPKNVTILKKDAVTGEVIEGVTFQIVNEVGEVVYKGTTDMNGQITFSPETYGSYAVVETWVPAEYELSDEYLTFKYTAAGLAGETVFYNHKLEVPQRRLGRIEAFYRSGLKREGTGWIDRDGKWHPFPRTGEAPFWPLALVFVVGLAGFLAVTFRGKKKRKPESEN